MITDVREKSVSVVTSITEPVFTTWTWGQREAPKEEPSVKYQQKLSLVYASPSRCWGLGFSREKGYGAEETNPTYLLQLSIVFMGTNRDLPSMGDQVSRYASKS